MLQWLENNLFVNEIMNHGLKMIIFLYVYID